MAVQHAWHPGILRAMAVCILAVGVEIEPGHAMVCGVLEVHWGQSSILCFAASDVQNKLQLVSVSDVDLAGHQLGCLTFLCGSYGNCLLTTVLSNLNKEIKKLPVMGEKNKEKHKMRHLSRLTNHYQNTTK